MSATHPEHLKRLEERRNKQELFKAALEAANKYAKAYGLKFFHLRPGEHRRGLTVAYRFVRNNKHLIEVAVATVHPNDNFSKQIGRITATQHIMCGQCITLRMPKGWNAPMFLAATFRPASFE